MIFSLCLRQRVKTFFSLPTTYASSLTASDHRRPLAGTLRETAVYLLAALATLASVAPKRLGLAWLRPPQMRSEKLLGDED
jgi:hypothetical protein